MRKITNTSTIIQIATLEKHLKDLEINKNSAEGENLGRINREIKDIKTTLEGLKQELTTPRDMNTLKLVQTIMQNKALEQNKAVKVIDSYNHAKELQNLIESISEYKDLASLDSSLYGAGLSKDGIKVVGNYVFNKATGLPSAIFNRAKGLGLSVWNKFKGTNQETTQTEDMDLAILEHSRELQNKLEDMKEIARDSLNNKHRTDIDNVKAILSKVDDADKTNDKKLDGLKSNIEQLLKSLPKVGPEIIAKFPQVAGLIKQLKSPSCDLSNEEQVATLQKQLGDVIKTLDVMSQDPFWSDHAHHHAKVNGEKYDFDHNVNVKPSGQIGVFDEE